jgi:hypothetical protein
LLIRGTDSISPLDLLALMAIQNLIDRAGEAFGAAQDSIDQAESQFKAREASRRFGFFRGGASRT